MMTFPSRRPITIWLLSEEMAIDLIDFLSWMAVPILARGDVSRNEMAWLATVAMNLPLPAIEME